MSVAVYIDQGGAVEIHGWSYLVCVQRRQQSKGNDRMVANGKQWGELGKLMVVVQGNPLRVV